MWGKNFEKCFPPKLGAWVSDEWRMSTLGSLPSWDGGFFKMNRLFGPKFFIRNILQMVLISGKYKQEMPLTQGAVFVRGGMHFKQGWVGEWERVNESIFGRWDIPRWFLKLLPISLRKRWPSWWRGIGCQTTGGIGVYWTRNCLERFWTNYRVSVWWSRDEWWLLKLEGKLQWTIFHTKSFHLLRDCTMNMGEEKKWSILWHASGHPR